MGRELAACIQAAVDYHTHVRFHSCMLALASGDCYTVFTTSMTCTLVSSGNALPVIQRCHSFHPEQTELERQWSVDLAKGDTM